MKPPNHGSHRWFTVTSTGSTIVNPRPDGPDDPTTTCRSGVGGPGHEPTGTFTRRRVSEGMELELRFFATFRAAVGQKTIHREYPDGSTVGEVLRALEEEFEGLAGELVEEGEIRDQLSVLKNGREVLHMEGIETTLEDGDTLSVFPPVAGGYR